MCLTAGGYVARKCGLLLNRVVMFVNRQLQNYHRKKKYKFRILLFLSEENVSLKGEDAGEEAEKSARQCAVSIQQHAAHGRQWYICLFIYLFELI